MFGNRFLGEDIQRWHNPKVPTHRGEHQVAGLERLKNRVEAEEVVVVVLVEVHSNRVVEVLLNLSRLPALVGVRQLSLLVC